IVIVLRDHLSPKPDRSLGNDFERRPRRNFSKLNAPPLKAPELSTPQRCIRPARIIPKFNILRSNSRNCLKRLFSAPIPPGTSLQFFQFGKILANFPWRIPENSGEPQNKSLKL